MPAKVITTRTERASSVVVVYIRGELDMFTADIVERDLRQAASGDITAMVLDLSGLRFFGSSGLRMLLSWQHKADERGFALRVVAAHKIVRRPLALTGLDELLDIHGSVARALAVDVR